VATEFLTEAQIRAAGRFEGVPPRSGLDLFVLFDAADGA